MASGISLISLGPWRLIESACAAWSSVNRWQHVASLWPFGIIILSMLLPLCSTGNRECKHCQCHRSVVRATCSLVSLSFSILEFRAWEAREVASLATLPKLIVVNTSIRITQHCPFGS